MNTHLDRRDFLTKLVSGTCALVVANWSKGCAPGRKPGTSIPAGTSPVSTVAIQRFQDENKAPVAVQSALEMIGGLDKIIKPGEIVSPPQTARLQKDDPED